MKNKNAKFVIVVGAVLLLLVIAGFKNKSGALVAADADPAAVYKAKCAVCHTAKAEKFFNPGKSDDELAEAILKGRKNSRPPMPEYATKGVTPDAARALVAHMRGLRSPGDAKSNANANSANANSNANANAPANSNANTNTNSNVNAGPNANAAVNVNAGPNANSKANANRVGNANYPNR